MPLLSYALLFRGEVTPTGIDDNVLRVAASAPGCIFRTRLNGTGVAGSLRKLEDGEARCDSEVIRTGTSTFQEVGTIVFGTDAHRLRFSTLGSGWIGPASTPWRQWGAAIWRIDGGDGQFAGATGLVASIFRIGEQGRIVTSQLGMIDTPEAPDHSRDTQTTNRATSMEFPDRSEP